MLKFVLIFSELTVHYVNIIYRYQLRLNLVLVIFRSIDLMGLNIEMTICATIQMEIYFLLNHKNFHIFGFSLVYL